MEYPKISICMPIYNRNKFISMILTNLLRLDYEKEKLELVIIDDGEEELINTCDIKKIIHPIKLNYHSFPLKRSIGEKRNLLVKIASYKTIVFMDSDDLYFSSYLKHSLNIMRQQKCGLVGSNQMLFLYPHDDWKLTAIQCSSKRLIHEATMMFTRKYFNASKKFKNTSQGEGANFIDDMNENNIGLTDITKCMICICHNNNTVNKDRFKEMKQIKEYYLSDDDKKLILDSIAKPKPPMTIQIES